MKLRNLLLPSLLAASMLVTTGCESVTHENLDKWANTQKGPGKLMDALKSSGESAEIRAHAAQVLIFLDRFADVKEVLAEIDDNTRHKIVADLAERLRQVARINNELDIPTRNQSNAKDAIFYTMEFADSATKEKMANYVIEWFVGGRYEARAKSGRVSGALAIREIGGQAGKRLLNSTKAIVNTPPDASGHRPTVKDELLQALAISGDKEALVYLMDLAEHPRGDSTLPKRVIDALYYAFVEPTGITPVDGKFLQPVADRISPLVYDGSLSSTVRNDSMALLVTLGPPDCIPYFTKMIGFAEDPAKYRWMGVQKGIRCSKLQGMQAIIEALAPEIGYKRGLLDKYLWDEIVKHGEKPEVASAAEQLLKSDSWVARITGIEVLARVGNSSNVESINALKGDKARLKNWWGDQSELPKGERKPIPTIGELAANVAQKLASGTEAK